MELLKLATEWAKAEVFSTRFFIFFAILFLIASIGFWQLGKTDLAKAYILPTLVAALLILFINTPTWRAISITTIAMLIVILLVDGTAHSRIEAYHKELKMVHLKNEIEK